MSTLIKWFPDRRGMATGMAIMGFGGGAMIGAPLADKLMKYYATPTSVGVWETFLTLAVVYLVFMLGGALRAAGDAREQRYEQGVACIGIRDHNQARPENPGAHRSSIQVRKCS